MFVALLARTLSRPLTIMHTLKLVTFFCVFFLFFVENVKSLESEETIQVGLYYEPLCPFCKEFIEEQLYPAYGTIGNHLNLELVPFGNTKQKKNKKGKWTFTCQHGPKECKANKIQACALWQNNTQAESVAFIGCIMGTENPEQLRKAKRCAEKSRISYSDIKMCVETQGDEVLSHFGDITKALQPPLPFVPYILFNNVYNETVNEMARENFLKTVCSMFSTPPSVC